MIETDQPERFPCDDLDGCGAPAGTPCEPGCPNADCIEHDTVLDLDDLNDHLARVERAA